jgi:hypothetical protein
MSADLRDVDTDLRHLAGRDIPATRLAATHVPRSDL